MRDGGKSDVASFGFDGDGEPWLDHLVEALAPREVGSIGPYEVIEEVARGGQGVVYRARQVGTRREIALKRLVEGRHASPSALRRFEREIEVAATLDHPGVVTVYGVETVDGVPMVAMQWIDGVSIDAWARDRRSGPGRTFAILRLFLRVCDAVEHAHRRGVLHLDLKPSNVLVDDDDLPHVVDFGLALVADRDAERTRSGAFLGTLAYASPEQLEGERRRLDVRSDVYSLGVLLYEMLTGEPPFAFEEGITPALLAKQRGDLERVRRAPLGGELRAIVARALAPRREERYPTVAALAEDVRRRLDGRPVLAHPPGLAYELSKLARRHKAATFLLLLSLGLLAGAAVQARRHAVELEGERNAQIVARGAAERAERHATAEASRAAAVLAFLLRDVFELALPQNLGADLSLGELLDVAAARSGERFEDRPAVEAKVRSTVGWVYTRLGRFADAERELERAAELLERLPAPGEDRPLALLRLGLARFSSGRGWEALDAYESALSDAGSYPALHAELHTSIGQALYGEGDVARAAEAFARALAIAEEHDLGVASRLGARSGLGLTSAASGRLEEARERYEEAMTDAVLGFGRDDERVATVHARLADLAEAEGRMQEAIDHSRESLRIVEAIYGADHPDVAAALGDLGSLLGTPDRLEEGGRLIERAIAINVACRGEDSVFTAMHRCRLGRNLVMRGRAEDALAVLEPSIALLERERGRLDGWVRVARQSRAMAWSMQGRLDEAIEEYRHLCALHDEIGAPLVARARDLQLLAQALHLCGRPWEACSVLESLLTKLEEAAAVPDAELAALVSRWRTWFADAAWADVGLRLEARARELGVLD